MREIDARGKQCPIPVIETKKELETMNQGQLKVLVDNEIAVQNIMKLVEKKALTATSEKKGENVFEVIIHVTEKDNISGKNISDKNVESQEENVLCQPDARKENMVVVLSSNEMGSGDEKLGKSLMKAFVFALTKQEQLPKTILLYNSGAYLSCEGSDTLEDLKTLEAEGVEIFTCGTCLNFYGLEEKRAVGSVTNMYDIVEMMEQATKIVRP